MLAGVSLPIPPPGGALDHLVIPAIGLSRYVVQGVDETDLQMGPATTRALLSRANRATSVSRATGPRLERPFSGSTRWPVATSSC